MDTSKTSSIKCLLMQAWRERWCDVRWGINIKNVLPRGVSGDVYDLADCILEQAMVGPIPNQLLMSYLTHCLSSQIISYGATFSSVARFDNYGNTRCLQCLLDLVGEMQQRVVCHGNEEECIALCKSTVSLALWLYNCMIYGAESQEAAHVLILSKSVSSLAFMSRSTFLKALLFIGRREDDETYQQLLKKHSEAKQKLQNVQGQVRETVLEALALVKRLDDMNKIKAEKMTRKPGIVIGLVTCVTVEAILNPGSSIQSVADVLQLTKSLLNIPNDVFYSEILRSCLMGMAEVIPTNNDLRWTAFTYLKLPLVLERLNRNDKGLYRGLETLLTYKSLLDTADSRCSHDCVALIVSEFAKMKLLTEDEAQELRSKRVPNAPKEGTAHSSLIIRAEPTMKSILSTLDTDYTRNPDAPLAVLKQMITGMSFELILSAAASTGKLGMFVRKLAKFNDQHNAIVAEREGTRAMLFDITFLMLCHIAQVYGVDTVVSNDTRDSFFAQWVPDCLVDPNRYTCPEKMLSRANREKVDLLLQQLMRCGDPNEVLDFSATHQRWSDLAYDLPAAIKEILIGWEQGNVTTNTVKAILEQIKSKMCFLPVVISTWLSCHINILHHEERLKPINIMNQFQQAAKISDEAEAQDNYKDRQSLTASIVKKMMFHFHPSGQNKISALTDKTPLWTAVQEVFDSVHSGNWIDIATINSLKGILDIAGPVWFCDALIRQALKYQHQDDLNRAVELAYGIFQIDIQHCALALLTNVLPNYLLWESKQHFLTEPKLSALAKLVTLTTMTALNLRKEKAEAQETRRKHPYWDMELHEALMNHSKSKNKNRRMNTDLESLEDTPHCLQFHNNEDSLEPLVRAIAELFRLLYSIATEPQISQRSFFPLEIFKQFVTCDDPSSSEVLQFLPLGFISQLVRSMPNSITPNLVLALSSFATSRTRKVVARAICQLQITQDMI
ncbi:mediator of RNA polymerase II transcription subunit 24 [Galendromus occidentalis]|uniref:Mediator of RNA polymerase II transcription subunit 24 n=1 Tax=Galendromus occidentalis TaxID=34638 RepID=A0AAJ6QX81_9ACAR|nr:mediator of RNA polymerase II transcription subunit 24 [Galendromus occidentalis]